MRTTFQGNDLGDVFESIIRIPFFPLHFSLPTLPALDNYLAVCCVLCLWPQVCPGQRDVGETSKSQPRSFPKRFEAYAGGQRQGILESR